MVFLRNDLSSLLVALCSLALSAAVNVTVVPDRATGQFSVLVNGRVWFAASDTPVSLHGQGGAMMLETPLTVRQRIRTRAPAESPSAAVRAFRIAADSFLPVFFLSSYRYLL